MESRVVSTFDDLDKWLGEHSYFEDGHILSINDSPLEIIVGYNVKGDYKANSERHILPFKLIPSDILEWTFDRDVINTGDDNYIEAIEPQEVEIGICLEFSTPAICKLTTTSLLIQEQQLIKTTFKPWISDTEVFVMTSSQEIPKPQYWSQKLKEYGHNIAFRYFAGEERSAEQLPYPDYQGYYIQLPERIPSTREGIFLSHVKLVEGKLYLSFENKDKGLEVVWNDLMKIVTNFPDPEIHSGNCVFTGAEWNEYVKRKLL